MKRSQSILKVYLQDKKIPDPATAEDLELFFENSTPKRKKGWKPVFENITLCHQICKQVLNIDIIKGNEFYQVN